MVLGSLSAAQNVSHCCLLYFVIASKQFFKSNRVHNPHKKHVHFQNVRFRSVLGPMISC